MREPFGGLAGCRVSLINKQPSWIAMATQHNEKPALPMPRNWRDAVPNDRLGHLVKDAARAMARGLQIRLMEHSVSYGYWPFLRILWEREGLTQRDLAELAGLREPTAYNALQQMEKLGYITRRKLPGNMRNICVYLTPSGKALQKQLIPLAEDLHEVAVRGIADKDLAIVRKALQTMVRNLEEDELEANRLMPPSRKIV
ncbi:MarR family transcriptional regulator [Paraburkholderia sp. RL18-101-BIB-B]|uniref:MarR family winged helix-turn-helix transcriptional regulator n=1 Tax=unclassified Paraburkholderia TaxID=2615204 RepID=UPI0038BB7B97